MVGVEEPMKILYFINAGIMGGRERHVHTLVKSLPGHVEYCVCAVSAGEATEAMVADGVNVTVLGGRSGHDFKVYSRFKKLMRTFKPDVVHAHTTALLPFMALRSFKNVPVILSVHGPSTSTDECVARQKSIVWQLKSWIKRKLQRRPDYYLPVSRATWLDFLKVCPNAKGEVFFNALNFSRLPPPAEKKSGRIIGMVGRMADQKDWPSFVRIVAEVLSRKPDVEAWAIGDGPVRVDAESLWKSIAAEKGIVSDRLKWFGSRQDARELIAQMDVFILSSKHEQLPTTMLEAFVLKTPVVGFLPMGGTDEIVELAKGTCALLNKERDVANVANDVIRVLDDKILREQMVSEGYKVATEYFDMEKICASQLVPLYARMMGERK